MTIVNWGTLSPGQKTRFLVALKKIAAPIDGFVDIQVNQIIFVHIPKNAGTSISKMVYNRDICFGHYKWWFYEYYFGSAAFSNMFSFACKRNPYSRLLSAYSYLKIGGNNKNDLKFSREFLTDCENFESFVVKLSGSRKMRDWLHFQPQCGFVFDDNDNLRINYLASFEDLDNEVKNLGAKINRSLVLSHEKKANDKHDYRNFYTNDKIVNIVKSIYEKDFELMDYSTKL